MRNSTDQRSIILTDTVKILLLDAANQNTLAIVRHLGKAGHEIHLVGYQKRSLAFYSKYAFRKYIFADPRKDPESYMKSILELISKETFGMIMPVGFKSYQICSQNRDAIRKYTRLIITSDERSEEHTSELQVTL